MDANNHHSGASDLLGNCRNESDWNQQIRKVMKPNDLKKLRNRLGKSIAEAAMQVHITPRSWLRYESGERRIPEGVAHLFCVQNKLKYPTGE